MRPSFSVELLDYELPPERIAQEPAAQRDASRLLVLKRIDGSLTDVRFTDLPGFLKPGDLLVLNDTRVIPARFMLRRATGGRVEGLYLAERQPGIWEVLLKGAGRLRIGETLAFATADAGSGKPPPTEARLTMERRLDGGRWRVRVAPAAPAVEVLTRVGSAPLPPYIHRPRDPGHAQSGQDRERYQTVYARSPGAIAAPTAGLHFTEEMLHRLRSAGIESTHVTLHVGAGTFAPIQTTDLRDHAMHAEWYDLPTVAESAIAHCRERGGRIVAVGTTSLRVLETRATAARTARAGTGWTDLFCYPPFDFGVVDALLTNFHLPRSTLLALAMAFAGVEPIRAAYRHAVAACYRFFSYGDAMIVL